MTTFRSTSLMLACLALLGAGQPVLAAAGAPGACHAASGPATLPLVELFTSEGCSSCPPADRWLSKTFPLAAKASPEAAVLAFHVDYWDQLGWRDRFANAAYTQRQYAAMRANHARVVYTPQVLLQGRDRGIWQETSARKGLHAAAETAPRARIALDARHESGEVAIEVEATSLARSTKPVVMLALTESALGSEVRAGENAGVHLIHDHVVRAFEMGPAFDAQGKASGTVRLPLPRERGRDALIVAFVQDGGTGEVLQSIVLPLCPPS
ncbi:MAG: DUF1223 domain-containing protein [Betaproteobacteria bacterium]